MTYKNSYVTMGMKDEFNFILEKKKNGGSRN